jgi:hypothetical protein
MKKRLSAALVSLAAALSCAGPAEAAQGDGQHESQHHHSQHKAARRTRQRARVARQRTRARRHNKRRAVAYVCPMHDDIRERARGTCPKCLMDLVAEPRDAKAGDAKAGDVKTGDAKTVGPKTGAEAAVPASGGS